MSACSETGTPRGGGQESDSSAGERKRELAGKQGKAGRGVGVLNPWVKGASRMVGGERGFFYGLSWNVYLQP